MVAYVYKARTAQGELLSGQAEGNSEAAVAEALIRTGLYPIEIRPQSQTPALAARLADWLRNRQPKLVDLMLFTRQMASLIKAGVPILRALASLAESSANPAMRTVLNEVRAELAAGRELAQSLGRYPRIFPSYYVNLVRVGEGTGRLEEVFMRLFQHLEFEREMRERVKSALRYPAFVVLALLIALAVINTLVIPAFAKVYQGANVDLPLMTRILIEVSNFTLAWWPFLAAALAGAILAMRLWLRTDRGNRLWDRWLLRLPVVGKIVHKAALARFAKGLAMTYQSGVPIVQGLTLVSAIVGNAHLADRLEYLRNGVARGEAISRAARATGVFTPVVLQMLAVGEETGELDRLLLEIGELYQREVEYEVKTLAEQVEPLLIAALGAIVLVVALGVFLPMWDLGATLTRR